MMKTGMPIQSRGRRQEVEGFDTYETHEGAVWPYDTQYEFVPLRYPVRIRRIIEIPCICGIKTSLCA